jgi:Protein of unknown function (DUF2971)
MPLNSIVGFNRLANAALRIMVQIMTTGLFKYFSTDRDKLEWFASGKILLTPPEFFNDPWDFLVSGEPYDDAQLDSLAQELKLPFERLKQDVVRSDFLPEESRDYQKQIGKQIGVMSLAENPLDRVMWAHYAESHRGFVAEFRHGDETEEQGIQIRLGPFGPAGKVSYPHRLPKLKRNLDNMPEVIWTKHLEWKYEKEWRVVQWHDKAIPGQTTDGKLRSLLKFEPSHLARVIFGLRICPTVEAKLREMLGHPEFKNVRKEKADIDSITNEMISCGLA